MSNSKVGYLLMLQSEFMNTAHYETMNSSAKEECLINYTDLVAMAATSNMSENIFQGKQEKSL